MHGQENIKILFFCPPAEAQISPKKYYLSIKERNITFHGSVV
jgi:hypothetical protein